MRLRLLSYNIHRAIGMDRRFRPQRILDVLYHHDADVVLLQEVDRGAPRSRLLDLASYLARQLDYHYHAAGMNVYLRRGLYGNATLSRWPIGRQRNIDLTVGDAKRRGCQHTQIHVTSGQREAAVDVFNMHLSLADRLRNIQVRHLLGTEDVHRLSPDAPVIIAGDTNDWRGVLRARFFEPAGFICATTRGRATRWALKTYPSFAPSSGLDKVFFRGGLKLLTIDRSRLLVARVASDHLPVIADFEVRTEERVANCE